MVLEITEYCLALLSGGSLAAKLQPAPELTDRQPAQYRDLGLKLQEPVRAGSLKFCRDRRRRHCFPKRKALEADLGRASALHFFANHELLAIEVLARALVIFPEAPKVWRWEALKTIEEEQRHLRMYIARMRQLGLDFGDFPLNDYIWKRGLDTQTFQDFMAFFSLALEGGNLDYSFEYMKVFEDIGDAESARLMGVILADEVQHVRRGLKVFDRARDAKKSQYQCFEESLIFPMTPARSRGRVIHSKARRAAGFTEDFVRALKSCPRTRSDHKRPKK